MKWRCGRRQRARKSLGTHILHCGARQSCAANAQSETPLYLACASVDVRVVRIILQGIRARAVARERCALGSSGEAACDAVARSTLRPTL